MTWLVRDDATGRRLAWTWDEHGGPTPALPTREGFGMRLLTRILTVRTAAEVDVARDADGLRIDVRMPLRQD